MNQEVNLLWFDKVVDSNQKEFNDHMWNAFREFMEWNEGVTEIFTRRRNGIYCKVRREITSNLD